MRTRGASEKEEKVGGESRAEGEERDRVWSESPEDGNAMRRQGFRLQFPLSGRQVWNERGLRWTRSRDTRVSVYISISI